MSRKDQTRSRPSDGCQTPLAAVIASNLKRLLEDNNITQKELAGQLNIAASSMSDFCNGRRVPDVEFFIKLRNLYEISIDDFLTKNTPSAAAARPRANSAAEQTMLLVYQKYCGAYYVYYFDTSKYKGRDTLPPRDSVHFGILYIYEDPSAPGASKFRCAAILGIKDRDSAKLIRKELDACKSSARIEKTIAEKYLINAYFGEFELSQEHAFVSMSHDNTDKALLIFHRVDNNKPNYTGGIGTINSISKGRERAPVIQFIGISRYPLSMSVEEIHHCLLLNYPTFKAVGETDEIIKTFKTLYVDSDSPSRKLSEYQKAVIVRSTLDRFIKKSLERNMFRYGKISERDDDEWYHAVKDESSEESR